ncbi:hypothetical protein I317_00489 [Kwoniella heveanensis CBS 569]|nr:hypothetical protein I317_00489 [Kwoniella heveanensis CBS 569]
MSDYWSPRLRGINTAYPPSISTPAAAGGYSRRGSLQDPSETYAVRHDPRPYPSGRCTSPSGFPYSAPTTSASPVQIPLTIRYNPRDLGSGLTTAFADEPDSYGHPNYSSHRRNSHNDPYISESSFPRGRPPSAYSQGVSYGFRRPSFAGDPDLEEECDVGNLAEQLAGASIVNPGRAHATYSHPMSTPQPSPPHHRRGSRSYAVPPTFASPCPSVGGPVGTMPFTPVSTHSGAFPQMPQTTSWGQPGFYGPSGASTSPRDSRGQWSSKRRPSVYESSVAAPSDASNVTTATKVPNGVDCEFEISHGDFSIYKHGEWAKVICRDAESLGQIVFKHEELSRGKPDSERTFDLADYTQATIMKGEASNRTAGTDLQWVWMDFLERAPSKRDEKDTAPGSGK